MKDFLQNAKLVKGAIEARMWNLAREELSKCSKPILLVSDLTDSNGLVSIARISQMPRYGKKCKFDILEEIRWVDLCTSGQPLCNMVNELLAKHCRHGNKIFISEIAYELCYEEDFSWIKKVDKS